MNKFGIPNGTSDILFADCTKKQELKQDIQNVFESYGYQMIETPTIEYFQTYQQGFVDVQEELMYKFFDEKGRIVMLRCDMTIPIARVAATKCKNEKLPLRFAYCANVYKVKQSFAGKKNEVSDCGVELLGGDKLASDLEILTCALEAMATFKSDSYTLELCDVNFFQKACHLLGLNDECQGQLASLIDRKALTELEGYLNKLDIDDKSRNFFMKLPWLGGNVEILEIAKAYCFDDSLIEVLNYLKGLYDDLAALGYRQYLTFDLGKLPHLNYYSGLIFEGFIDKVGNSVLSGGRYDNLLAKFNCDMSAIGFSVKLDDVVKQYPMVDKAYKVVIAYPYHLRLEALKQAKAIRNEVICELVLDNNLDEIKVLEG